MTDLCPSCREPLDYPSGDGCAAMTKHYALDPDLPAQLEALAHMAAIYGLHIDDMRVMPAADVAGVVSAPTAATFATARARLRMMKNDSDSRTD